MGNEPHRYLDDEKMIFQDRNEIFLDIKSGLENIAKYHEDPKNAEVDEVELNLITSSMQKRSDKAEILFDTNGSVQKLDINKKSDLIMVSPEFFLTGTPGISSNFFYEIKTDPENREKPVEMKALSFDDMISRFDAGINKDAPDYELRKNVVLWDKLGFESLKDDVMKSLAKSNPDIKKPRRGFFGTIADWFTKDTEGRRRYERQKDVYHANLCKYNAKNIKYDKELVDSNTAAEYINGTRKAPEGLNVNAEKAAEAQRKNAPAITMERINMTSAMNTLSSFLYSNKPEVRKGAMVIKEYIANNKQGETYDALIKFLVNGTQFYVENPKSAEEKKYVETLEKICSKIGRKGINLKNENSKIDAVKEAAGFVSAPENGNVVEPDDTFLANP